MSISPSETVALRLVHDNLGWTPATARRFTTGLEFFVYEVTGADGQTVVVRLGQPEQSGKLANGVTLAGQLRPLGVPLPRLIVDGSTAAAPFIIMERLAGTDLGHVFAELSTPSRLSIAAGIADAQLAATRLGVGSGFGYASNAELAPHASWTSVVEASISRSRQRLVANGLYDPAVADPLVAALERSRGALDGMPPLPFLHDATTKNVIVSPAGELSGIVDVDDLCFGDPRYAVALTRAALLSMQQPGDYTDAWLARMSLADDAVYQFYIALFLLDFMAEHGMVFNGNQAPSDAAERARLAGLYAAAIERTR